MDPITEEAHAVHTSARSWKSSERVCCLLEPGSIGAVVGFIFFR